MILKTNAKEKIDMSDAVKAALDNALRLLRGGSAFSDSSFSVSMRELNSALSDYKRAAYETIIQEHMTVHGFPREFYWHPADADFPLTTKWSRPSILVFPHTVIYKTLDASLFNERSLFRRVRNIDGGDRYGGPPTSDGLNAWIDAEAKTDRVEDIRHRTFERRDGYAFVHRCRIESISGLAATVKVYTTGEKQM